MNKGIKFILKILLIIVIFILAVFLILFLKNLYDIKTGKLNLEDYSNNFTKVNNIQKAKKIDYTKLVSNNYPYYGDNNPELTIVEFGSFSCPYSKKAGYTTRKLMLKYKDDVKFIYRDFPIDELYPDSSMLALAGKCANAQGKFWPFHDKIFNENGSDYYKSALQIGLNEKLFKKCVENKLYVKEIMKDLQDGIDSGVRGTPTFFFIKKGFEDEPVRVEGVIPENIFEDIINNLLKNL